MITDLPDEFQGYLTIIWPKPGPGILGERVTMLDADTGQPITSVVAMKLAAAPGKLATAELLMLVNERGEPLTADEPPLLAEDGEHPRTGVFHWLVAEMRTAD